MEKELYKIWGGWGYRIKKEGKIFIQQEVTPCLQGKVLMSKERANRLANLVLQKLKEKPNELPTLTIGEVLN